MRSSLLSALATFALGATAALPVAAQDTSHPAGVYVGTCPVPGNLAVSLWDVSPDLLVDGEADAGAAVGSQFGYPVEGSVTLVEMALADLIDTEHAILVHRSQAGLDDYLVCGDIGGVMNGPDELAVALAPVGLSPWSGIAILNDEGDGTTTVSLHVFEGPGIDTASEDVPMGPFPSPSIAPRMSVDVNDDAGDKVHTDKKEKKDKADKEHEKDEDGDHGGDDDGGDHAHGGDDDD